MTIKERQEFLVVINEINLERQEKIERETAQQRAKQMAQQMKRY